MSKSGESGENRSDVALLYFPASEELQKTNILHVVLVLYVQLSVLEKEINYFLLRPRVRMPNHELHLLILVKL